MKINDFIKKYNAAKDKDKFLTDHIKRDYVPYHEKIADCDGIIKISMERDGIFKINTPAQYMMFMIQIIVRYTDIEKDDGPLEFFEKLDELNLIDAIVSKIPEREFNSYNTILNMIQSDYMENNRNIISFFETKFKALGLSVDTLLETIQQHIPQNVPETKE